MFFIRRTLFVMFCLTPVVMANTSAGSEEQEIIESSERFGPPVRSSNKTGLGIGWVDITYGGTVCYFSSQTVYLWRPQTNKPEKVYLKNTSTQEKLRINWAFGKQSMPWPQKRLSLSNGTSYLLSSDGGTEVITFYQVPEDLTNKVDQNTWMREQGCLR
ncbi:hypothetical protein QUF61_09230 [Candidatus Venteria ishoeyi]|uniref:hypothetical protein n=1 Tax=Candidatus Venteria ishoeyi TaxID=1899563 RepID=UPI0025A627B1|nr:hypothetical protein [Candidatus Venteria ishoeyi]MDM8546660.1 hypothetical protein [Candidatus Venteria ishoeyi]